jgi:hypothetical protein
VGSRAMNIDRYTDVNSLYHLYKRDSFKINKGMLALFNRKKLMSTPILNMTELNNSVVYVNGPEGKFGYQVEYEIDYPYSLGNVNDVLNVNLGVDGQKFKFKCSENCFTATDIITYDYQDGVTLYIHDDEVIPDGDGFIYTVSIPQKGKRGGIFPIEKLKAGVQFFKITNANGEYDVNKSGISYRTGQMDLEVQMGGHLSAQHWITGYADMLEINDTLKCLDLSANEIGDAGVEYLALRFRESGGVHWCFASQCGAFLYLTKPALFVPRAFFKQAWKS